MFKVDINVFTVNVFIVNLETTSNLLLVLLLYSVYGMFWLIYGVFFKVSATF